MRAPLQGAKSLRVLSALGMLRRLAGYRYVPAPTKVMMIGTRVER